MIGIMKGIVFPCIISLLLGIGLGYYFQFIFSNKKEISYNISRSREVNLTNPLIDCEQYESSALLKVNTLKKKVEKLIKDYQIDISLYYRNLNNGPWFGINESTQFSPHSLLKVPILIAYLKKAEFEHDILVKRIQFLGTQTVSQNLLKTDQLKPNTTYTVDELLERMISLSDNTALELLYKNIEESYIISVHKELDIPYPNNSTPSDYLTVRSYASLFRILYNSTYLSRSMSEKALSYLLKSDLTEGIRSSLPKEVKTALKYGIMPAGENAKTQFHECGIIYANKNPYILCIMTKGNDLKVANKFMHDASKLIYEEITKIK